jgi:hypothetical protein
LRIVCRKEDKEERNKWRELTVALHDGQELDNDLGGRSDQDLALASLLGVVDGIEAIVEDGSLDHFGGCRGRFSMAEWATEVSVGENWWLASRCQSMESALSVQT